MGLQVLKRTRKYIWKVCRDKERKRNDVIIISKRKETKIYLKQNPSRKWAMQIWWYTPVAQAHWKLRTVCQGSLGNMKPQERRGKKVGEGKTR